MDIRGFEGLAADNGRCQVDSFVVETHLMTGRYRVAVEPQPRHTSVGEDVETNMGDPMRVVDLETRGGVTGEGGAGDDLDPVGRLESLVPTHTTGLQREGFRVIAGEMGRVDRHGPDPTCHSEGENTPIVARLTTSTGLPTVHPFASIGVDVLFPHRSRSLQQVVRLGEELVVAGNHPPTNRFRYQIGHCASTSCHQSGRHSPRRRR